jgi:hypothetical protein
MKVAVALLLLAAASRLAQGQQALPRWPPPGTRSRGFAGNAAVGPRSRTFNDARSRTGYGVYSFEAGEGKGKGGYGKYYYASGKGKGKGKGKGWYDKYYYASGKRKAKRRE